MFRAQGSPSVSRIRGQREGQGEGETEKGADGKASRRGGGGGGMEEKQMGVGTWNMVINQDCVL